MTENKCIIDIETGGFSIDKHMICEIGLVIIDCNNEIIQEYSSLIMPYLKEDKFEFCEISEIAQEIHHITLYECDLNGQAPEVVVDEIDIILHNFDVKTFIGHNIKSFDAPRLNKFFNRFGIFGKYKFDNCIDTMTEAKNQLDLKSYSLASLCSYFGIVNETEHRALSDVKATFEAFKSLNL